MLLKDSDEKNATLKFIYLVYYRIYLKYWNILTPYYTGPKIWTSPFYYILIMCLKTCWMSGKQCRPWSDTAFCGVWPGLTLFAQVCMSE